jgi:hypothetical protein
MLLTDQFKNIVKNLRYDAPDIFPKRRSIPAEQPDLLSVYALASAMEAIYHNTGDEGSGLAKEQGEDGGLGIMCAAINYAWVFECLACDLIDWDKNAEVWPYWVQEHAGEILALTGEGEPYSDVFQAKVKAWLMEQPEIPFVVGREVPGEWIALAGRNQPLPEQHTEVFLLTGLGQILKGYREGDDWFPLPKGEGEYFQSFVTHWAAPRIQ